MAEKCMKKWYRNNSRKWKSIVVQLKHTEEGLERKNLQKVAIKYHSDHRKHWYELAEETKKQSNRIFIDEKLAIKVTMGCRTTSAKKIKTRLGFKQYDVILAKGQWE